MPSSTNTLVPDGVTPTTPYTLQDDLASQNPGLGASLIGVAPNGCFTSTNVQDALEEICAGGGGGGPTTADQVSIVDAGGYYTSDNVEGALQEVGADLQNLDTALNNLTASEVAVVDAGGYYTATDVEGVLQEIGASTASWNAKADNTITITGTNGLQGGGDLTANRTLEPVYGTTANTVTQGNDSRLSDARSPTGVAGGDLGGTYPNPTVEKWQGKTLGLTTPFVGQSPVWNGTAWVPGNVPAGGSGGGGVTYFLKEGTTTRRQHRTPLRVLSRSS